MKVDTDGSFALGKEVWKLRTEPVHTGEARGEELGEGKERIEGRKGGILKLQRKNRREKM